MKTIFRNFINTLRRFKMASALNILGLSVAFAAFVLILMQVRYEFSYDKFHPNADRIYRAELNVTEGVLPIVPRPMGSEFGSMSAAIEDYVLIRPPFIESYVTVERNGAKTGFVQPVPQAEASFGKIFSLPMIEGEADALKEPTKALLPASLARTFFGQQTGVLGRKVTVNGTDYEVGGVYRDFPANSQFKNTLYLPLADRQNEGEWGSCNYQMYVLLHKGADPKQVEADWSRFDLGSKMQWSADPKAGITLLSDVYYDQRPGLGDSMTEHGKRATTDILLAIALLVIGIAAVNFVNFSTSLTPLRIKSIN
ncbi:MAG: ABC transporter permease, partial [Rikenellaceae bacterium]|nr:ABC transporter permease [Rikenellaceae bacterium]